MRQLTRKLAEVREAISSACSAYTEDGPARTVEEREATNANRRNLYAQLDARRIELDKLIEAAESTARDGDDGVHVDSAEMKGLRREVEDLVATLVLQPVQPKPWALFLIVDILWRAPACFLFVMFMGCVTSVPLVVLTMVEHQLFLLHRRRQLFRYRKRASSPNCARSSGRSPAMTVGKEGGVADSPGIDRVSGGSLSSLIKRLDAWWVLLLMGVAVKAEGLSECGVSTSDSPAMLLFSHVSTLDAMIILSTFPRAFCAVVKEELFALPIIGWIMASHGGVPINRRDRASAVQALAETAERAREMELFVAMAPEGTRSKTGQLGPFKKGALHMQEQLQWPVIPVTIRGAYELFPLKSYYNQCGKVIVRFHSPIPASEVKSRDGLAKRLRHEMLEAVAEEAPGAGHALALSYRMMSVAACAFTYWAAARSARLLAAFSRREGVEIWALVAGGFAYMVLSTLFVYFVYARRCFSSGAHKVRGGSGKEGGAGLRVTKRGGASVDTGKIANGKANGTEGVGKETAETKLLLGRGSDDSSVVSNGRSKGK